MGLKGLVRKDVVGEDAGGKMPGTALPLTRGKKCYLLTRERSYSQ
jgi:hypothetical protein